MKRRTLYIIQTLCIIIEKPMIHENKTIIKAEPNMKK